MRTITASLVSASARPVVDVTPIPANTNEVGAFERALDGLIRAYGQSDLCRLVSYDAGACSKRNADAARRHGLHYLFGLKASQPTLFDEAVLWLGVREPEQADATTADVRGDETLVRRLYLGEATAAQWLLLVRRHGGSRLRTRSSMSPSRRTTIRGSSRTHAPPWSSWSCVASRTRCSRCGAA
ncbi:MAG: hypothetical protein IT375_31190 [Polyangiaceae bacterium]|nr:hypothetical protein [Polyangiaceae bacterium]